MIDIIIVNFNSRDYLLKCVKSALASTVPVDVFVVDNGSEDKSLSLLKSSLGTESCLHLIENKENLGFAKANNQALALTKADYILFLNPDCIIKPNTIEEMIKIMESHPDAGIAGCLIRNPDGSEQAGSRRYIPTPWRSMIRVFKLSKLFYKHPEWGVLNLRGQPLPDHPVPMEAISGAFMFVRRKAMEQVGQMDEMYFLHCEDLDWCMRYHIAGWKILFVPHVEIIHKKGVCSNGRPIRVEWHKHAGMVRFYRKFFRDQYPNGLMYMVIAAVWTRFAILAIISSFKKMMK
ncbi:MAG: glycosyltransferase family 2 protein [Syntrophales bacterium]